MNDCLPTFLIIGAQKAGTTSLHYFLKHHPEVFMSAVKEPQYFASAAVAQNQEGPGDSSAALIDDISSYQALFEAGRGARARGEASTIYLYDAQAPARIHEELPNVKLIAILRDPVERAYSNFLHLVRDGREPISDFAEALRQEADRRAQRWSANWRYHDKGLYAPQIERYLRLFDRNRVRFYLFEDFVANPSQVVRDLYQFLGVNTEVTQDLSVRLNVAGVPRSRAIQSMVRRQEKVKWLVDPFIPATVRRRLLRLQNSNLARPTLSPQLRAVLLDSYREDIARVGELTGLDVARWTSAPVQANTDERLRMQAI